jgi:multimeric flavodoxin WrbA
MKTYYTNSIYNRVAWFYYSRFSLAALFLRGPTMRCKLCQKYYKSPNNMLCKECAPKGYYVYIWFYHESKKYYVGKGSKDRMIVKHCSGNDLAYCEKEILLDEEITVFIIMDNLTEEVAYFIERLVISILLYKNKELTNRVKPKFDLSRHYKQAFQMTGDRWLLEMAQYDHTNNIIGEAKQILYNAGILIDEDYGEEEYYNMRQKVYEIEKLEKELEEKLEDLAQEHFNSKD